MAEYEELLAVQMLVKAGAKLLDRTWRPSKADSSKLSLILPAELVHIRYTQFQVQCIVSSRACIILCV